MGIPQIAPYDVPACPQSWVSWRLDPSRAVLLVHDMQRWFVDRFAADDPPLPMIIKNINSLRTLGLPTVFTAQPPAQEPHDRGLLTDFWGPGIPSAGSAAIHPSLAPSDEDVVLTKWRYSAFVRTRLEDVLQGRDQLIITGVYAHIGIVATACDAFMRDIQPFIVADAVADFSAAHHSNALVWAAQRCAMVTTTAEVLS